MRAVMNAGLPSTDGTWLCYLNRNGVQGNHWRLNLKSGVLPSAGWRSPAGRALKVPTWRQVERLDWVCWIRVFTFGELWAKLSWINWFSSWVNVDICAFSGSKSPLILSSIKSCEIPLAASSVRSGLRDARDVCHVFRIHGHARFYCISFPFLVFSDQKKTHKVGRKLILFYSCINSIEAINIDFTRYKVKVDVKRCVNASKAKFVLSPSNYFLSVSLSVTKCCCFLFTDEFARSRDRWQDAVVTISELLLALCFWR